MPPPPGIFGKKCTLRLNLVARKFVNYLIKLNIATELKTYCSIDDRLKISKMGPPCPPSEICHYFRIWTTVNSNAHTLGMIMLLSEKNLSQLCFS